MQRGRAGDLGLLVITALIYGGIFPVNRIAAEAGWPPLAFAFCETFFGGLALAAFVRFRGGRLVPTRRHLTGYVVVGSLSVALPMAVLTDVAGHVPAALLAPIATLSPILTLVFAMLLGLERFRARAGIAVLLGLGGVALIASPGSHALGEGVAGWFLLALLAPAMFAASNISASLLRPPATDSATMSAGSLIAGGLVALPLALAAGPVLPPAATSGAAWSAVLGALINAALTVLFFEIVRRAGPTFFSMFNYMALPAGALWSILIFGELPPPVFWLAVIVMLAGVYAAAGGRPQPAPT